jgi:hypothetical protein
LFIFINFALETKTKIDMETIITKQVKLYEVNNDKCHNYYYGFYGRIINTDKTRYKKFRFVVSFDIFDVLEYYEKELVSNREKRMYAKELAYSMLDAIQDYDNCKEFYRLCNETIDNYNKIINY